MADLAIDALALFTRKKTSTGQLADDPRFKSRLEKSLGKLKPEKTDGYIVELEALRAIMLGTAGTRAERAVVIRLARKHSPKDKFTSKLAKKLGMTSYAHGGNRPFEPLLGTFTIPPLTFR